MFFIKLIGKQQDLTSFVPRAEALRLNFCRLGVVVTMPPQLQMARLLTPKGQSDQLASLSPKHLRSLAQSSLAHSQKHKLQRSLVIQNLNQRSGQPK